MSDRIKTAWEIALERAAKINVSSDDLDRMEAIDDGKAIAARYLRETAVDLIAELGRLDGSRTKSVREGIVETLIRAITLPSDETALELNQRAMQGLLVLARDGAALQSIFGELDHLFNYYTQAYRQAYMTIREKYERQLSRHQQALEAQTGTRLRLNVERLPEFMDEWMKTLGDLNGRYEKVVAEQKDRMRSAILDTDLPHPTSL